MEITLLQLTPNALEFIGKCAGICYDSKDEPETNKRRATQCARKGHLATLRFAHATFNVSGISRTCSHQFVRSKHLDFLQRSQRYCLETEAEVIKPKMTPEQEYVYTYLIKKAQLGYERLIELGVKKEDARFVLPEATCTELIVTGNLQAWLDFIQLRSGKEAQWEIRNVAIGINNILAKECPNIFKEIE